MTKVSFDNFCRCLLRKKKKKIFFSKRDYKRGISKWIPPYLKTKRRVGEGRCNRVKCKPIAAAYSRNVFLVHSKTLLIWHNHSHDRHNRYQISRNCDGRESPRRIRCGHLLLHIQPSWIPWNFKAKVLNL